MTRNVARSLLSLGFLAACLTALPLRAQHIDDWRQMIPNYMDTQPPPVAMQPQPNLYWHDPYLGFTEHCQDYSPDDLGLAPCWYSRADAMYLRRDTDDTLNFATLGAGGPVVLSTGNFADEFEAGARVTLGRVINSWYRMEFAYFGTHSWDDTATVRNLDANALAGTGNLFSPFSNFGVPAGVAGQDYNNRATISFNSRLHNGEANLRRRWLMRPGRYEGSFLMGVRYLDITEEFGYLTESTTPGPATSSNDVDVRAQNRMIGVQIGMLGQFLFRPGSWIDFEMKGGIFANDASQSTNFVLVDNLGASTTFNNSAGQDRTSFVGELSLQYNYQVNSCLTLYMGYNALWITGVALGAENFESDFSLLTLGPGRLDHSGEVVYHGPNFGLVYLR